VLLDYGLEGYGLYWYCIELIASKVDKDNITFELEHDARIIARGTGSTVQKVEEMMRYFVDINLFENVGGVITCFKLAKRLDKSMTSNPTMRGIIEGLKSHDSIMTQSEKPMQDKIRSDQTRLDKREDMSDKSDAIVSEIYNYWFLVMQKDGKTKFTAKRKSKIKARLKEGYTEQQIKQAIDGCAASPYHMGQNDNKTIYNDIELICRSGEKVEQFGQRLEDSARQNEYSGKTATTINNLQGGFLS